MSDGCTTSADGSLTDSRSAQSVPSQSEGSARGERANLTLYALVAVGLLVVGLAAAVITGGVLGGDTPDTEGTGSDPAGGTDPTPVDDDSDENESADTVQTPDDGNSDENTTDGGDGTSDDSKTDEDQPSDEDPPTDDENTNSTDSDESDDSDDGPSPTQKEEVFVDVRLYDLGSPDKGEMRLRKVGSEEIVATHNFSEESANREFRYLTPERQYELTIDTPYYPEKTLRFRPDFKDVLNVTVGYEFNSTDSYVIEWEVDYLPQYFEGDHTSERAEEVAIPLTGVSRHDAQGNYYSAWDDPDISGKEQYYYNESTNQTFRNPESPNYGWRKPSSYWGETDLGTPREVVVQKGLSGVEQRQYLRSEELGGFIGEVHVYEVTGFSEPSIVKINPETGYPVEYEKLTDRMEDSTSTRVVAEYRYPEGKVRTKPADFPEGKFDLEN